MTLEEKSSPKKSFDFEKATHRAIETAFIAGAGGFAVSESLEKKSPITNSRYYKELAYFVTGAFITGFVYEYLKYKVSNLFSIDSTDSVKREISNSLAGGQSDNVNKGAANKTEVESPIHEGRVAAEKSFAHHKQ